MGLEILGPARGTELAYAEITSNVTGIANAGGDITGLTISFTVGSRPAWVFMRLPLVGQVTSAGQPTFYIADASNVAYSRSLHPSSIAAGGFGGNVFVSYRFAANTGTVTCKGRATSAAGTVSVFADASAGGYRPHIWAVEA